MEGAGLGRVEGGVGDRADDGQGGVGGGVHYGFGMVHALECGVVAAA